MNGHQNTKMSAQSKELSPISMITEQLSNLHLSENSGFIDSVRSFDVKKLFFGKNTFLSLESGEDQCIGKPEIKSPETDSKTFFYAVNIPKKSDLSNDAEDLSKDNDIPLVFDNKGDALKLLKLHKNARYKSFTSKEEAEKFSLQSITSETVQTPNPSFSLFEDEDGLPSVKCQDLVILRKAIEQGNVQGFSQLVWENARYLVNYHGDTPSILHEGFRYNALHIAARCKKPMMCQLILDTLSDPKFFEKLYKCDPQIRKEKIHHLLDQYLNNPDKRLGETPLHFASKFGCLDTVKILLSHPHCIKDKKNKYGETAAQTICTRCSSPNEVLRKNIEEAFKGLMYVPVLRAENNVLPPCIEKPCTKVEIEQKYCSLNMNVNSPNLLVKAFAGPMSPEAASTFYKIWKNPSSTPQRQSYTVDEQKCIHKIRLTDTEKGLERAGRNIAQDLNAEWIEYWPVLDCFINLASTEGLKLLESHLNKHYMHFLLAMGDASFKENCDPLPENNSNPSASIPNSASFVNPLGHYLNNFLKGQNVVSNEEEDDDVFYTPPSSPECPRKENKQTEVHLYVNGSELSRLDIDMLLAIRDINIDNKLYPLISKWKNSILSKLRSLENSKNSKSLTPLASVRIPRLKKRESQFGISPRCLSFSSE